MMTQMVSSVPWGMATPRLMSQSASPSEKFSDAKALPRKPASVMATWMVDRKRAGWAVSLLSRLALRFPSAHILFSFTSFTDRTAISAQANTALRRISATCKSNNQPIEVSKI